MTSISSAKANRPLRMPLLGLEDVDCQPLLNWNCRILTNPQRQPNSRRRRPNGATSPLAGSLWMDAAMPSIGSHARWQTRPMSASSVRGGNGPASSEGMSLLGDDDGRGNVGPTLNTSRLKQMQSVQAKLDRSRDVHSKAQEKRNAIHDAAKLASQGTKVIGVKDLELLDRHNYLHPLTDKRADLAKRILKHQQRGYTNYMTPVPFAAV